ncbi:TPA: hypothetical protein JBJ82_00850 [Legionella pneumophila]|nr:hypothetical protein [Legionella pneumophila]HAU1943903.1 hypothetical protein [Legionella pneumophila]HCX3250718.1 hypothetical protein [Legionella pneumophila]
MEKLITRWKRRKEALDKLSLIDKSRSTHYIIHYSCESFYKIDDGRTPRITSIAIRNLESAQTKSFSIHKIAEEKEFNIKNIREKYDDLEKNMLDEYFDYIKNLTNSSFIHWNMRDINYGFQAIEHRYKVLGGEPYHIDDTRKIDLARNLVALYSVKYMKHKPHGRLHNLLEFNKISIKNICTGEEEANAFDNGEYIKLHQSTLKKVDAMANIIERINDNSLITQARWIDKYGLHPQAIIDLLKNHWLVSLIIFLIAISPIAVWLYNTSF